MKNLLFTITVLLGMIGCKPVVEIEDPFPQEQFYCNSTDYFLGQWISDSVWITTTIDSFPDTVIVNKTPGLTYLLDIDCEESQKLYHMRYFNGSGVQTRDVYSTNYEQRSDSVLIFGQTDSMRIEAEFVLKTTSTTDTTFEMSYSRDLGAGQQSSFQIFFGKN